MVSQIKFLGVIIDNKLTWKSHIKYVQSKVSKCIAIINKAKYILNYKSLHMLYCSLVLPHFIYCIEVWGNNYKTSLQPLYILQKRAIRNIFKAGYSDHTNILFLNSKLLKLPDLVKFYTGQLMYKARNNTLPVNIQKLFTQREGGYYLRGNDIFKQPTVRTVRKSMCVSVCGVKLWNTLGTHVKQCLNIQLFKTKLKDHFLSSYTIQQ